MLLRAFVGCRRIQPLDSITRVRPLRVNYSNSSGEGSRASKPGGWLRWFGIPAGLGITCLALLQAGRTFRREKRQSQSREPETWQLALFRQLPARMLSRTWGRVTSMELRPWLRRPVLGLYVWAFGCNMSEAQEEELGEYRSLLELFVRRLKEGKRNISLEHPLVSPSDGKVLHFGRVNDGRVEQVKGVSYQLEKFLGTMETAPAQDNDLFHVVIYLAPGDCHHFHSPTEWIAHTRRHFPGELLTVAPWAARKMPGLFALNERAVLSGSWQHGFFSFAAVGAFNVGSIKLSIDEELQTNAKGRYRMGEFSDKKLVHPTKQGEDLPLGRGDRIGYFSLGSSIVLIFEAPKTFEFTVKAGQKVQLGDPLGTVKNS